HCPNVLVQALACQTAAVCSSAGGQQELVKQHQRGLIIEDKEFDYEICDYKNPPKMSFNDYHFSVIRNGYNLKKEQVSELSITYVTKQYIKLFESILR
ncbi:MAG: hypothetical protein AABY22_30495, partial [Nanoarchaeota archaeon]